MRKHTYLRNSEAAASKLTSMVFIALFAVVAFTAYRVTPFYYYYFELQNQMKQALTLADSESDQVIRKKIEYHIKTLEIPVKADKLKIARDGSHIKASLDYSEIFYIRLWGKDYDLYEFPFKAYAEAPVSR